MIPVTKPYLPDRQKLKGYIDGIYEREWLTNNGQLVQELTRRLETYLGVENLLLVSNGTLALQIAYRALGVSCPDNGGEPEAITTPFSFVATASSMKWEGVRPVFADIDPKSWCLDPRNIERAITSNTRAVVPVHVFGNACDVNAIDIIAERHKLKVIYDASHAFGVNYKGKSLLNHGDAATLSFHATKLFHTAEGGAIIFKHKEHLERARKIINFGISGPETIEELGINAKMNELQAALGLCVLDEIEENLKARARIWQKYEKNLSGIFQLQKKPEDLKYNYAYFPVLLDNTKDTMRLVTVLKEHEILVRRYFYPSLESIKYFNSKSDQPISRSISSRILCLPIFADLRESDQIRIIDLIESELKS